MNALSVSWATPSPIATRSQRYLRLVTHRRSQAPRAPFVVVVVALLLSGLLGLLLLNTVLVQDAFRLHALQTQGHTLADQEQALQRQVSDLQAPAVLAARASALGMVPGGSPAFLRLSDGKILGQSEAAVAAPPIAPAPAAAAAAATAATGPATGPQPRAAKPPAAKPADGGWTVVAPKAKP